MPIFVTILASKNNKKVYTRLTTASFFSIATSMAIGNMLESKLSIFYVRKYTTKACKNSQTKIKNYEFLEKLNLNIHQEAI
jgi:hypothetical protein